MLSWKGTLEKLERLERPCCHKEGVCLWMWRTSLHAQRVLLLFPEHSGQPKSIPRQAPGRCPWHHCAGADRKIVPVVCQLLRINTTNLWQSSALILTVNSLSLLQHIGCPALIWETHQQFVWRLPCAWQQEQQQEQEVALGCAGRDITAGGTVAALSTLSPWQQAGDLSCSRAQPQGSVPEGLFPVIKKMHFS